MGADVTVAVQAPLPVNVNVVNNNNNGAPDSSSSGVLASPDKPKEATGGLGLRDAGGTRGGSGAGSGVEVRLEDARAVIVRGEREGGVGEGGLRRVGFEIGEWVRGWEEREEREKERAGRRGS